AGVTPNASYDGSADTVIADDVAIADGESHVYTVAVDFTIDAESVTFEGSDCSVTGTEDGTGLLNTASLEVNDATVDDEECPPQPGEPVVEKTVASGPTPVGNGRYEVVYAI